MLQGNYFLEQKAVGLGNESMLSYSIYVVKND